GGGRARFDLGGGHHGIIGTTDVAPGISYRVETPRFEASAGIERLLDPVWSDLAPGETPFLQRTWVGVLESGWRSSGRGRIEARFLFGRTRDRALVARLPLQEMTLREGIRRDRAIYDFGLLSM